MFLAALGVSRRVAIFAAVGSALGSALTRTSGSAQDVSYSGSLSYSTGAYVFTDRSHSFWLSNTLELRTQRLTLSASLPIVAQNSGVVSFVAGTPLPTGGKQSGAVGTRDRGDRVGSGSGRQGSASDSTVTFRGSFEVEVGDPLASMSIEVYSGLGFVRSITLEGSAKAPLRSIESGVGTGAWDYGAGGSMVVGRGRTLAMGDVSYWSFGDLPELELRESVLYTIGVSRAILDSRGAIMLSFAGSSRVMDTTEPPRSAGLGFLLMPGASRAMSLGASVGLSESSPDFSAWIGWSLVL